MTNSNRFYTYAYLREDGTPYYIGKGSGKRVYKKGKGEVVKPTNNYRIILLKQNLTEEEAFKHEKYMIAIFGRKDLGTGILRNQTDGGEGNSGRIPWNKGMKNCFSEEIVKRMSEKRKKEKNHNYRKEFSIETRKKMSENQKGGKNNFYGKKHTPETKQKISEKNKNRIVSSKTRQKISKIHKGKTKSVETIEKFRDNFKKIYILISPSSEIIEEYETINRICKKYNLDISAFLRVLNKKQKTHKGWIFFIRDNFN